MAALWGGVAGAGLGIVVGVGGCKKLPAVEPQPMSDDGRERAVLGAEDRAAVLDAMRSVLPAEPPPAGTLAAAPQEVRWSDIPGAVAWAGGLDGVEIVVVRTIKTDDMYYFKLRTIEDWPGEMIVRRGEGDAVYRIEHLWIGRFPGEPNRVERANKLKEAFEERLTVMGGQVWFNQEP